MNNKERNAKMWRFILGVILLIISLISIISIFAVGHSLDIKNTETLIMFVLVILHFISGIFLIISLNKNNATIKKIISFLLILTAFSFVYMLFEFSSIEMESTVNILLLVVFLILSLNIKVLFDFIKKKNVL